MPIFCVKSVKNATFSRKICRKCQFFALNLQKFTLTASAASATIIWYAQQNYSVKAKKNIPEINDLLYLNF